MQNVARLRPATTTPARTRSSRKAASGVVQQVRTACRPENRLATFLGGLLGAFVPVASYTIAHHELDRAAGVMQLPVLLVLGGLLYSAASVYGWGKLAFRSQVKAAGFVVLTEGVLVMSNTGWLSAAALVLLAGVNAVATACNLVGKVEQ